MLSGVIFASASFAQTATKQKPAKAKLEEKAAVVEPSQEPGKVKLAPHKAMHGETPGKKLLKKDGTPDLRMAENKEKKDTARRLKKDGTPDLRFKENKKKA